MHKPKNTSEWIKLVLVTIFAVGSVFALVWISSIQVPSLDLKTNEVKLYCKNETTVFSMRRVWTNPFNHEQVMFESKGSLFKAEDGKQIVVDSDFNAAANWAGWGDSEKSQNQFLYRDNNGKEWTYFTELHRATEYEVRGAIQFKWVINKLSNSLAKTQSKLKLTDLSLSPTNEYVSYTYINGEGKPSGVIIAKAIGSPSELRIGQVVQTFYNYEPMNTTWVSNTQVMFELKDANTVVRLDTNGPMKVIADNLKPAIYREFQAGLITSIVRDSVGTPTNCITQYSFN